MLGLDINLEGDKAFEDWQENYKAGNLTRITILPEGMESGLPSIALGVETEDGEKIIAQTSWALLHNACRAFEIRYGTPHLDRP
jgi:hypothetical protein